MTELEIRCEVSLWERIVLATQADTNYQPLQWTLGSGTKTTVSIEVPEAARTEHAKHSSQPNYFINTTVNKLSIALKLPDVLELDISRLRGTNTAEKTHHAHFEGPSGPLDFDYQSAEDLGRRVVHDILDAVNKVIRFVRINYGQHWLELIPSQTHSQNYLDTVKAKWLNGGTWMPLVCAPHVVSIPGGLFGGTRSYLEISDWNAIQAALMRGEPPSESYALISDAKARFEEGDKHIAVLYLNSAMEAAVDRFIEVQLGPRIPPASLKSVLKENYDRLLNNWVLPLSDQLNLDLRKGEWASIKKIQDLRRESGHPEVVRGIDAMNDAEWFGLVKDATSAIAKLTGMSSPKAPHPMYAELQSGTD
jgi:hypothetical protein